MLVCWVCFTVWSKGRSVSISRIVEAMKFAIGVVVSSCMLASSMVYSVLLVGFQYVQTFCGAGYGYEPCVF